MTEESHNGNGVTVTLKDVYMELLKVKDAVHTMSPLAATIQDHETRLRGVEKWKYALPATIVTSTTAIVIAILEGTKHG